MFATRNTRAFVAVQTNPQGASILCRQAVNRDPVEATRISSRKIHASHHTSVAQSYRKEKYFSYEDTLFDSPSE